MNYKRLSLLVFFGGIILLLTAMIFIPVGGMAESNPDRDANAFFFGFAEIITLLGLIMYTVNHINEEKRKERLQDLKNECDLNAYESTLGEEQV
ncbi:MAG: hypothetical protein WCO04_01465 [Pseudomonadota bacterium]